MITGRKPDGRSRPARSGSRRYRRRRPGRPRRGAADASGIGGSGSYDDPQGSWYGDSDPYGDQADTAGAAVIGVESGTPAARAGLTAGDVITRIGSRTISSADELSGALGGFGPRDKVTVNWTDSNSEQHSARVTLGASPVS